MRDYDSHFPALHVSPSKRHPGSWPGTWLVHVKGRDYQEPLEWPSDPGATIDRGWATITIALVYARAKYGDAIRLDNGYTCYETQEYRQ